MKIYFEKSCRYFYELVGSLWISMIFVIIDVSGLFIENSPILESIVTSILMTITIVVSLFLFSIRRGYKEKIFNVKKIVIAECITWIIHIIYCLIFSFSTYTSGPAFYLGKALYGFLHDFPDKGFPDVYKFATMWLFSLIYLGTIILGEYVGTKIRFKDYKKLISTSSNGGN